MRWRDRRAGRRHDGLRPDAAGQPLERLALELDGLGKRLLHERAIAQVAQPHALLDPRERRRRVRLGDDALLHHQPRVARDLRPRVGEHALGIGHRARLQVDEHDARAAECERQRDLAADAARPEHRDAIAHASRPYTTTICSPMPLLLWVRPRAASGTWRAPASPRSWAKISAACATPVAPRGWPQPMRPPRGLTTTSPP